MYAKGASPLNLEQFDLFAVLGDSFADVLCRAKYAKAYNIGLDQKGISDLQ